MMNSIKRAMQMTLSVTIPVAVILGVVASTLAQGPRRTEPLNGPKTVFLPIVMRDYAPTSFELIEQALASGEIDDETALAYKVFSVYLDPRLPGRFIGNDGEVRDTLIAAEVGSRWSSLSPATQALLAPFLLPPAAPGSWLELQQGQAATVDVLPRRRSGVGQAEPIEWVTLTRPGGEVKVWYQTRYPGDDVIAAQILADLEDKVWPALTELMGRGPVGDDGEENNGGDGLFDVYVVRIKDDGEAQVYEPSCEKDPAFVLINGATTRLPATIVHTFMHAITASYDVVGCQIPEYWWLDEATATWAEDFISPSPYDTHQDEQRYAGKFLRRSAWPLETRGGQHEHGAYLWPFYLARTYSPELIRTIWDATASKKSLAAIDGAISGGFLERWPEFAKLNLNREPVDDYHHWDGLTERAPFWLEYRAVILGGEEREIGLEANVAHLAARYYHITFPDPDVTKVRYENGSRFYSGAEPRAKVQALVKLEGQGWKTEDWTGLQGREFCRTKPSEKLEEMIIIFSNSEWEDPGHVLDPGSPKPLVRINAIPCSCEELAQVQNWTGQVNFSFTTSASEGDETVSIDHSATVSLQMVPDYQNSSYVAWKHASLGGTGRVNDFRADSTLSEDVIGSGDLYPGGTGQDDPGASLSLRLADCTFQFHLQTGLPAVHTWHWSTGDETFSEATWAGLMDINDVELTGSRTVPAIYYPSDEDSWYVPGGAFDGALELLVGNDFGQATVSWTFAPDD